MRVLIADDSEVTRMILVRLLEEWGYEVVRATHGLMALEHLLDPAGPRLAILDWLMPGMDGLAVVKRVRLATVERPVHIIMLTSQKAKPDVVACLEAGADDYVAKPFDKLELRARVGVGRRLVEAQETLARHVVELRDALEHVKQLQGIIPICSFCHRIRDDQGAWARLEAYITHHSEATFSHGVCPECERKHYPAPPPAGSDG